MKASVYQKYGSPDVLELREVDTPTVADDEVLVRVHAGSVNPVDWHFLRGTPFLLRLSTGMIRPKRKTLGRDMAGRVEAVGRDVAQLRPGDEIFGMASETFAEYLSVPEDRVALKPVNLTYEQAAAVPLAAITALQGLRKGQIQAGQKVLINGASGGVGTFAVQIAKGFGTEVTGVCSTRNLDMVRSIGADHVVDYTQQDFTKSGQRYDLILDAVGNLSLSDCKRVLSADGICVAVAGTLFRALRIAIAGRKRVVSMLARNNRDDVGFIRELVETGKVSPVIDRRYPLSEVAEAVRYLEEGHAQGKVIITV